MQFYIRSTFVAKARDFNNVSLFFRMGFLGLIQRKELFDCTNSSAICHDFKYVTRFFLFGESFFNPFFLCRGLKCIFRLCFLVLFEYM